MRDDVTLDRARDWGRVVSREWMNWRAISEENEIHFITDCI